MKKWLITTIIVVLVQLVFCHIAAWYICKCFNTTWDINYGNAIWWLISAINFIFNTNYGGYK